MDDLRIGSVTPYDPIHEQSNEDARNRRRRKQPGGEEPETEDVVSLSGQSADAEERAAGYGPNREEDARE